MAGIYYFVLSIIAISSLTIIFSFYVRAETFINIFELEGYKNANYLKWIDEFKHKIFSKKLIINIILIFVTYFVYLILKRTIMSLIIFNIIYIALLLNSINYKKDSSKISIRLSEKNTRIFISLLLISLIEIGLYKLVYIFIDASMLHRISELFLIISLVFLFIPYNLILANYILMPIEKIIKKHQYDKILYKMSDFKDLKIVGVTGSFGKATTSIAISRILEQKFNVLKTPKEYNTFKDISTVINEQLLKEKNYDVFVVEMGARNIGDIAETTKVITPSIGIITSIGPTNLDTFINVENIMKTKYELIENLPTDGIAVFNYDNKYVKKLADKTFKEKILYGTKDVDDLDIYATDIEITDLESRFVLRDKEGNSIKCKSKLTNKYDILNILGSAAVGKALGLTFSEILKGIENIKITENENKHT